jgi:nucleoside-diphosphate-sugar epimerase
MKAIFFPSVASEEESRSGMRILLTGANSFLGRHLLAHLSAEGFEIVATHRANAPDLHEIPPSCRRLQLDIGAAADFSRLPKTIDAIVHIAGVSHASGVALEDMVRCNVDGAVNLLNYAREAEAKRLIYTSTLSIHGDIDGGEVTEATPVRNPGTYGATKFLAERLFAENAGALPAAAIRLPGMLGKGAHRAWIPSLLDAILAGREIAAFSPDASFNNAAHVRDLAALVANMLRGSWTGFHAFPVGASGILNIREVITRMLAASGRQMPIQFLSNPRPGFTISSKYARDVFAYRPQEIGAMIDNYVREALR